MLIYHETPNIRYLIYYAGCNVVRQFVGSLHYLRNISPSYDK